jgi:hypothetical protein
MLNRRGFLIGSAAAAIVAPAIVRAASIMPINPKLIAPAGPTLWVSDNGETWRKLGEIDRIDFGHSYYERQYRRIARSTSVRARGYFANLNFDRPDKYRIDLPEENTFFNFNAQPRFKSFQDDDGSITIEGILG